MKTVTDMAKEAGLEHLLNLKSDFVIAELNRFAAIVREEVYKSDDMTTVYMVGFLDGKEAERKCTVNILMDMHRKANGQHNYYHFAANEIRGVSV